MLNDVSYEKAVKLADHYKAIGQAEIYLFENGKRPWEHVISCEAGGSHRLEIATDVNFRAKDPSGLVFRWSFDIEERSANGSGSYKVRTAEIQRICKLLPARVKKYFNEYLLLCAEAIEKKGNEYHSVAKNQWDTASALREAAK